MPSKFNDMKTVQAIDNDPVRRARVDEYSRGIDAALALSEVRNERELTQSDMAKVLGVTQANVSRIEREDDLYVSTLRGYVEAMGGRLELRAVFDERDAVLAIG